MRQPPLNTLEPDAIKAWKITALFYIIILWLATITGAILKNFFNFSLLYVIAGIIISGMSTYLFVLLIPKLRFRRWRYEVFDQEIYIQHGILIVTQTIVPMIRVQHVDTKKGPILKHFHLASVTISTAATTHEIPALFEEDASELRDRISTLARVDEDDV